MSDIDVAGLLELGEELYADVMIDTCRIRHNVPRSQWVLNPTTRELVPPAASTKYTGPCVLTATQVRGQTIEAGLTADQDTYTVDIPLSVVDVNEGDILEMLTCHMDAKVVGIDLRIDGVYLETIAIARSLVCGVDVPG